MSQEIKVYYTSWGKVRTALMKGFTNSFVELSDYFNLKQDYDKLEARCKELEFDSNVQIELGTELVKNLEEENRILKAKLEKCKEQRNEIAKDPNCKQTETYFKAIQELDEELDSIGTEK